MRRNSPSAVLVSLGICLILFMLPYHARAQYTTTEVNPVVLAGEMAGTVQQPLITAATQKSAFENIVQTVKQFLISNNTWISAIKDTLTAANTAASALSEDLLVVNAYVIQPLAYILSGNLLKAMTASVVSFVTGQTNGSGAPQFAQNVNGLMQGVGDLQTNVFLKNFGQLNSPFGTSIASALRVNYLQQTSAAGWFAANKSTLHQTSPNINAFLAGNWAQGGGVRTWFALTTQSQNNPFLLYLNSQSQISRLAGTAQSASAQQLNWGRGFLSWCGAIKTDASNPEFGSLGVSGPTPNCQQADGSPGIIKTPGSFIAETLFGASDSDREKLLFAGTAGTELNSALGSLLGTLQNLSKIFSSLQMLGGVGSPGGLAGAAQSYGDNRSILGTLGTSGFVGATSAGVIQGTKSLPGFGGDLPSRIAAYQLAWSTIMGAANAAQTAVSGLQITCPQEGVLASLASQVQAVLAQGLAAQQIIDNANVTVQESQTTLTTDSAVVDAAASLRNVPPTDADVAEAQTQARSSGIADTITATSSLPSGFTGTSISLLDQMNSVTTQAQNLKQTCVVQAP